MSRKHACKHCETKLPQSGWNVVSMYFRRLVSHVLNLLESEWEVMRETPLFRLQ